MAVPTVTASLNKAAYAPGETMILTVDHADTDRAAMTISITVTDSTGNTGTTTANCVIDQGTLSVVSAPARTWTLQAGATAGHSVYHAVA
jgi:hypothetical protein